MRLPDPDKSRVVLIGTTRYRDDDLPDLPAVGRSLADLAAFMTDPARGIVPREHCTVLLDEGDMRLLGRRIRAAVSQAEDTLVVYYSGHGLVGGKRHELYLALPDSEFEAPEFNSLEYDKLRNTILESPASNKVVILDCCFSGRALDDMMADPVTAVLGQLDVRGTYVMTSAQRDQVALALPGEDHTAFSGRLLTLLRNGIDDGSEFLTVESLHQRLRSVMRADGLPLPEKRATRTAELIVLGRNTAAVPEPAAGPVRRPPRRGNAQGGYAIFRGGSSVRLEIGAQGIQLFRSDGDVWIAWTAVERVAVRQIEGDEHLVAWPRDGVALPEGTAPDGPRLLPGLGALDICAIGVLDATRHEIVRALRRHAGGRYQASAEKAPSLPPGSPVPVEPPISAGTEAAPSSGAMSGWDDAVSVACLVEADRRQRAVDRRFTDRAEAVTARDALAKTLSETTDGPPAAPHVRPWVWSVTTSGGGPLTEHGRRTGVELRLSYYADPPGGSPHSSAMAPVPPAPSSSRRPRNVKRSLWQMSLALATMGSGLMAVGAIGATVTGGYADVASAIAGNAIFEPLFTVFCLLLVREARRARKRRGGAAVPHRRDPPGALPSDDLGLSGGGP